MYTYNALNFLLLAAPAFALPGQSPVEKRVLTPDNTCGNVANGNNHGYTCNPNDAYGGPCCSASGYCGGFSGHHMLQVINGRQEPRPTIVARDASLPLALVGMQPHQNPSRQDVHGMSLALEASPSHKRSTSPRTHSPLVSPRVRTPSVLAAPRIPSCIKPQMFKWLVVLCN